MLYLETLSLYQLEPILAPRRYSAMPICFHLELQNPSAQEDYLRIWVSAPLVLTPVSSPKMTVFILLLSSSGLLGPYKRQTTPISVYYSCCAINK